MRPKTTILLATGIFLCALTSFSQDAGNSLPAVEKGNLLFGLQVGVPSPKMQSAIRNNMGNIGFGAVLAVLSNPFTWGKTKKDNPLRIGGEIGYTYYGRFLSDVYINGYRGSYKTSYGILQANAILRLQPATPAPVRPFAEALIGGNFYLSSTKENLNAIETALGVQSFDIDSYGSVGLNKGVAVGCGFGKKRHREDAMFILRISYSWGSDIRYVERNSLRYNGGGLEYSVGRAPVDYVLVQAGIGL